MTSASASYASGFSFSSDFVCVYCRDKGWIWEEDCRAAQSWELQYGSLWVVCHVFITAPTAHFLIWCLPQQYKLCNDATLSASALSVINLHSELQALKNQISATDDPERLSGESHTPLDTALTVRKVTQLHFLKRPRCPEELGHETLF